MTTSIGATGAPYQTQIPVLQDNADIQAALRIYHYGSNTSDPEILPEDSIAGHFTNLESTKFNKAVTSISGSGTNLNTYQTTGWYMQSNQANARSGSNYPTFKLSDQDTTPLAYAGMLEVVFDGTVTYQTYHALVTGTELTQKTFMAWRANFNGYWSKWRQAMDDQHEHDGRYYQKSETYTRLEINSSITTLDNAKVSSAESNTIFVRSIDPVKVNGKDVPLGNPTAQDGDLWFW